MARTALHDIAAALAFEAPAKAVFAAAAAAFHFTFGAEWTPLVVMLALISVDGLTGVWKACVARELSSRGFRRGALKFFVYLLLMASCALGDKVMPFRFAFTAMTAFLAMTELISIMENVAALGWPVPTLLVSRLKVLQASRGAPDKPAGGV